MQITLHLSYTFNAFVTVNADNQQQAIEIVQNSFGAVSPNYQSSDDRIVDWNADVHPELIKVQVIPEEAKDVLAMLRSVNDEESLKRASDYLLDVFQKQPPLQHLSIHNQEAYFEEETSPTISFEMAKLHSSRYISCIKPEYRDGKLVISVRLDRTNDDLGLASKSWETVQEDFFEINEEDSLAGRIELAVDQAIENHTSIIQECGVSRQVAGKAAVESWL